MSRLDAFLAEIGNTPMSAVDVTMRGRRHRVLLKRESANPTGSVKDRTAAGLLRSIDQVAPLVPGTVIVESTSGNLGLALARMLPLLDCRLISVVDPTVPVAAQQHLAAAGAEVRCVREPDGFGGYLLSRLAAVRAICAGEPGYRWTNQYDNPANPGIHQATTGPEIARQAGDDLDAVYVAVSTGGTLAGVSAYLRSLGRPIRMVAVDAEGSMVTGPVAARRLISGIGASRPSSFISPASYDRAVRIADAKAIAACRILQADTGISLGGSSGGVLHACLSDLALVPPPRLPVCLSADDGAKYQATVYDDGWLTANGLADEVEKAIARLRADDVSFSAVAA